MFKKISTKQLFIDFGKAVVNSIKNNSSKLYNNLKNNSSKIKYKKIYEYKNKYNDYFKILIIKDGNLLLIKQFENNFELIDGHTFKNIKNIELKNCFNYISEAITLNKNEILFCNGYFNIGYIELDNEYNIKNYFYKNYENKDDNLISLTLKITKNGKIIYMGSKSSYKKGEEETIGLTRIYILNFNKIKKEFIFETKINSFKTYFYEIKTKNEYLINIKKDFVSIVDSKNIKVKKEIKFNINEEMRIINDKYFIQGGNDGEINIFNLENFQLIKSIISNKLNDIISIFIFQNNIFFTFEEQNLELSSEEYFVKKWEFIEEKNEIICLGYIKIKGESKYLYEMERINDKDEIYLMKYFNSFEIIQMFSN